MDINKLLDLRSKWCYLIKQSGRLSLEQAKLLATKGEDMELALKFLYELSADHRRQAEQEAIEKFERDQRGIKQFVYEKGREEGMQAVALAMLKEQADIQFISKVTGFSEQKIKNLKNNDTL